MEVSKVILSLLIVVYSVVLVATQSTTQNQNVSTALKSSSNSVAGEGGPIILPTSDTTHMGREHMMKVNHQDAQDNNTHMVSEHMIKVKHNDSDVKLPAFEVGQKNDNKTSVPKKDAVLNVTPSSNNSTNNTSISTTTTTSSTTSTTTTTTTTTTPEPRKPTITIGEDEEPPSSNTKTQSNGTQKHGISIESVTEKTKKTDYVVPIVAVILSVPLVAIVFSVLYKRGADWWQHRHYRRMDFLIEGMYNN